MFQRTPKHVKPKPEKGRLTLYIYGEEKKISKCPGKYLKLKIL